MVFMCRLVFFEVDFLYVIIGRRISWQLQLFSIVVMSARLNLLIVFS